MAEEDNIIPEVFIYTEGAAVPQDVVRVRVHPSVTAIPEEAFQERTKIEEVELCEGLLEIGGAAFSGCGSLANISIPSSVTLIGIAAFSYCDKLEEVVLREGLLEIGESAFRYCAALKQISVPSTVAIIQERAFEYCIGLERIELCDGLQEIGNQAFERCMSVKNVKIPSTVIRIGEWAFAYVPLVDIRLPDCLESIGSYAVARGNFPILRIPPLITTISRGLVGSCEGLMSIELSDSVTRIEYTSFSCQSLRNVAIPQNNVSIDARNSVFGLCDDLEQLFGTEEQIIHGLKHRFDNLPVHKMIYYQSYNNVTSDQLNSATDIRMSQRRSKVNPTGSQRDCLGMTPLHILACSTVQNLELYKVLVTKYPENLITEDRWGALPLLYAVWGDAPDEILQFLVDSYKSLYPDHELNWTGMMASLRRDKVSRSVLQALLDLYIDFVPDQIEELFEELAEHEGISLDTFRFIVQRGYIERVNTIGLKQYRDAIMVEMEIKPINSKLGWLNIIRSKLVQYEEEYRTLKEATTLLELLLWKNEMDKSESSKKRKRAEESDSNFREQCRIGCRADIVIEHVLPFLVPPKKFL